MVRSLSKILILAGVMMSVAGIARAAQSFKELTTPPFDTADAQNVRIWIPVERPNACQLTIRIFDSTGAVVRHLFDNLVGAGYYNFYWDKRDDTGAQVAPGRYKYAAENCGKKEEGAVMAAYSKWERLCRVVGAADGDSSAVDIEILADSASVSIYVYTIRDLLVDSVATDSIMYKGTHRFRWNSEEMIGATGRRVKASPGNYKALITVGDYVCQKFFKRRP